MQQWLQLFTEQAQKTTLMEWLAVILGIAEVLLARKNNILLYPAGIVSSAISILLFFRSGLYADAGLSVYYVVLSVYGWVIWSRRRNEPPVEVAYASKREWRMTLLIAFGGWAVIYWVLITFTPSTVPVMDAWVSSSAWAGTWLLARRRIENWIVLNVSNLFAIPLLFYKHLPLFALLTFFLFIVAILGFFDWRRIYNKQLHHAATL